MYSNINKTGKNIDEQKITINKKSILNIILLLIYCIGVSVINTVNGTEYA